MLQQLHRQPDIYRILVPLPKNPLRYLNAYVIKGKKENLVIDTGFKRPECEKALREGLQELDVDLKHTALFLTHLHGDHTGLVHLFADAGCPVYMNQIDYDYLVASGDGSTWKIAEDNYMREGMPPSEIKHQFSNQARTYSPDPDFAIIPVADGDEISLADCTFRVVHTPGHTPGQCCLYLPQEEIFFTADHILFNITPNIQVWYHMPQALQHYLDSLEKVKDLPVRLALPGHREGQTQIRPRVEAILAHHQQRLAETWHAVYDHPDSTAYEIAPHLTWSMRGRKWPDFPPTQKWFALGETLAHLEYLVDHHTLTVYEKDGIRHYGLPAMSYCSE